VSYLTEELVAIGHQVTLFASGDSVTAARLHAVWPRSLRLDPAMRDVIAPHMLMMEEVRQRAEDFDVLHFHLDYWPFSIFTRQRVPFVTTLHGRLDLPELQPVFDAFRGVPVVSIALQGAFAIALALSGSYERILNYVVSTVYVFMGLLALALFVLRARDQRAGATPAGIFRMPWHPVSTLVVLISSWGVAVATYVKYPADGLIGLAILISAVPVYFVWKRAG